MSNELNVITKKMGSILFGLLRCQTSAGHSTWQVKAVPGDKDLIHCIVTDDRPCKKMLNKHINIIQKYKTDYLFIAGKVCAESKQGGNIILSIRIQKACWFELRSNKYNTWLEEKFIYENFKKERLNIAS